MTMFRTVGAFMIAVSCALLVSSSLSASQMQYLGKDSMTVRDLVASLRVARENKPPSTASTRIRPEIVSVDWTKESFIIPAVGNLQGANGTFFRSDVTIANRRSV